MGPLRYEELMRAVCRELGWRLKVSLSVRPEAPSGYAFKKEAVCWVMKSRPELGWLAIDVFPKGSRVVSNSLCSWAPLENFPSEVAFRKSVDETCFNWLSLLYGGVWRPFKEVQGGTAGGAFPYRSEEEAVLKLTAKGLLK